jgi:SAM-dependent methyltransferase
VLLRLLDSSFTPRNDGRNPRILDVGCGTGTMVRELRRYGRAQGIDADEAAVHFSRKRGIEEVEHVPEGPLPFEDASFALVTALDVIEHVEDDRGLIRELSRILAPGGMLLVTVPAFKFLWGPQDEISHHKRRYTAPEVKELLRSARFEVARLSYFNTLLFPAIAVVRLLRPSRPVAEDLRSDFELTKPGMLNATLARVFAAEAPLVARMDLPVGVSILALATRAR